MTTAICTLFEGHYHYGVAALSNSLYRQGYRGAIYAGYRGTLPAWAATARENISLPWAGGKTLEVAEELQIHFLPLATDYHLTNYKPDFMLRLWEGPAKEAGEMYYFDPDIVVTAPWSFLKNWVEYGVALCEDVNSPLAEYHPRRVAWRRYFEKQAIALRFKDPVYVNGGFIGLNKANKSFLTTWQQIQEAMAPAIGGLNRSALAGPALPQEAQGPLAPFGKTDQDALNAAIEAWEGIVSFVGQEAMALKAGVPLMPHALGQPKPWQWEPLAQALAGRPPRLVDREYWKSANGTIVTQPPGLIQRRLLTLRLAALIGRFYRRR